MLRIVRIVQVAIGLTCAGLLLQAAVAASTASAICEKTYEANTGNMKRGCTGFERPGLYIEISAELKEVKDGVYCSSTVEANEGNYQSRAKCEKGEEPNVVKGNYIRTLLPLNCKGEEVEQIEKSPRHRGFGARVAAILSLLGSGSVSLFGI